MAVNKLVVGSLGVAGVAVGAWLGAGLWVGQRVEAELQSWQRAPQAGPAGLRLTRLNHERSLWGATGQMDLRFQPGCAAEAGADEAVTLRVDYKLSHFILPGRLTAFDWRATPLGDSAELFKSLFGADQALAGSGQLGFSGGLRTEMNLPELAFQRSGEALQMAPSRGFLSVNGPALAFGWTVDRLVTRGHGTAMEAKAIVIDVDLSNRHLGTGSMSVSADQLSLGMGTLEGLSLKSQASVQGDRLDMTVTPALRRVKADGVDLSDLSMELAMKGLDTRSVETLSRVFEASCGMQSLTAEEGRQARDAAMTLLARGLTVGIQKVAGKGPEGAIDGQFLLAMVPARDGKPSLAAQLKAQGHLEISSALLPAQQREMVVATGMAVTQGKNLRAGFDYADGLLKLNERSQDASALLAGLNAADAELQTVLAGWGQAPAETRMAKAPDEATDEAVEPAANGAPAVAGAQPVVVAQSLPAPVPVSPPTAPAAAAQVAATGCQALPACVQQSLAAARRGDIDSVRQAASAMDALAKPEPGNRPISRQLNTAGLEALKRDDLADALAKLRLALKENPRDVEIAANLGFTLVKAGQPAEAVGVLQTALVLDPRRTSTWTPLAEAYALAGRADDAKAAMWVSFQWSANRDKSLAFYQDRMARETRAPLQALYSHMVAVAQQQMTGLN